MKNPFVNCRRKRTTEGGGTGKELTTAIKDTDFVASPVNPEWNCQIERK